MYARFNKRRIDGAWEAMWLNVLWHNKQLLYCSTVQLDGSHTPAKHGGAAIGYQECKKARTTTALFLVDNQGQPQPCATPQAGNHHDSYRLATLFEELCQWLEAAGIAVAGKFVNAYSAFDTNELRQTCAARDIEANIARNRRATNWQTPDDTFFDSKLYRRRVLLEHANAWLDSFKILIVRYQTSVGNWRAWHLLAFVGLFLRKFSPNPQPKLY
ncbi:transposase [Hymenobacter terrestris]|uniref:Transposase n=1 Tax=Hymenobacter terrestris TaxID=2748310 RepID=A0ABX2Q564_9BACT|nr:transposase [Hymenobacter terrestris]NVO86103.1 transposase [Hymenobacter terrestris]